MKEPKLLQNRFVGGQILNRPLQRFYAVLCLAEHLIARLAQDSTDTLTANLSVRTARVVMIDIPSASFFGFADCT